MKFTKNLNSLSENEFVSIFGSVFEKSEWIANEAFRLKPFKNAEDLIDKMTNIYKNSSTEKIVEIFKKSDMCYYIAIHFIYCLFFISLFLYSMPTLNKFCAILTRFTILYHIYNSKCNTV